jgi:hypothetical protein
MQTGDLVFFSSARGENEVSIGDFVNSQLVSLLFRQMCTEGC